MSPEEQLRQSLDTAVARLRGELEARVGATLALVRDEAASREAATVEAARRQAQADREQRLAEAVERARQDTERSIESAVAHAREDADRTARAAERDAMMLSLERLLTAFEHIESAPSLTMTLDALADSVAAETARSIVFILRDGELRAWRLHGFTDEVQTLGVRLPLADAGPLAQVLHTKEPAHLRGDSFGTPGGAPLPFAQLTAHEMGIAVPVTIGLEAVAVVYADDGGDADQPVPAGWPEVVQLLARHASRHLAALTAIRAANVSGILKYEPPAAQEGPFAEERALEA